MQEDQLNEFTEHKAVYPPAGILLKRIAGIIDAVIELLIAFIFKFIFFHYYALYPQKETVLIVGYLFIIFFIYRITTIFIFNCTLGMLVLKLRYQSSPDQPLTTNEKILAACMIYINGVKEYNIKERL